MFRVLTLTEGAPDPQIIPHLSYREGIREYWKQLDIAEASDATIGVLFETTQGNCLDRSNLCRLADGSMSLTGKPNRSE